MLGRLMDKCVQGEDMGGFVTNGLGKTINWILREDTEFPGEPGKTPAGPRNLFIRKNLLLVDTFKRQGPSTVRKGG